MTRYLSGLCVAGLGLCGGGWLVVAAVAFGGRIGGRAGRVNLADRRRARSWSCCLSLVGLGGGVAAADARRRRARATGSRWCPGARRGGTGGTWRGTSGAPPGWRSGRRAGAGARAPARLADGELAAAARRRVGSAARRTGEVAGSAGRALPGTRADVRPDGARAARRRRRAATAQRARRGDRLGGRARPGERGGRCSASCARCSSRCWPPPADSRVAEPRRPPSYRGRRPPLPQRTRSASD